ncbi:cyclic pyranopterin monophosphate synthase subunit MoaA [Micromonospora pisi]|uniref:GTP 3',8-cyclase n=1 Tax=Micromonospora pisi TaxID=589240 RepID=A0A495JLA2_9ACTN|nr:GTP 3',8-cyclase MoaA [Micromonospora pisi]RKR89338.1 cyclic pyranopterin monophosphate synthase subunit MoaA [Micromonospora pisi]
MGIRVIQSTAAGTARAAGPETATTPGETPPGAAVPVRPAVDGLVDRYHRVATDLRVSLTDRCNLRCTYCMPEEGLPWLPKSRLLTDDEINRLVRVAVLRLGVTEVRFTGGEPLIRPGLPAIVAAAASLTPRPTLSLTTNGIGLARLARPLRDAGLDRVNVSLDTIDPDRFTTLTRRDRLADVLAGLAAASDAGLTPVKINSVLMRGVNDQDAPALLRFALAHGYELRFIEQMPLDAQHGWDRDAMVTASEILTALQAEFTLLPDPVERGGAPAETWLVEGFTALDGRPARVGVIGSVTRPFCGDCDRTRLTADGQVRACLFATEESDLREALRAGADDEELARRWRTAMWGKRAGHDIDDPTFLQPARPMSAIGG